jgi:AcrR family transcriptional regulator
MDPNVIFRNFGNTEGLFIAVLRELEARIIANISPQSTSSNEVLRPVDFVALFLTFYTSLLLSGIPPERLAAPVELAEEFRTRTFERLGIDPGLSDRTKQAVFTLAISLVLAQTMLLPNQPNVFTPESTVDAITLMMALVERLPAIAQDLSWEE